MVFAIFFYHFLDFSKEVFKFAPAMAHGVTGNTSGFGPEESRFEP